MVPAHKLLNYIKWNTRQRMQYIEIMAYYTGVVSRSNVARTFGISDAAATKDLKLYGDIAPDNIVYKQSVFGFVPASSFSAMFTDLSPGKVLPLIVGNLPMAGGPLADELIYGIPVERLPLPSRLPSQEIVAQVTRAVHQHKKLRVVYNSLSDRADSEEMRIIEPHSLINTGLRWHIRAYSEESFDFRDFVLSRISEAEMIEEEAESSFEFDDDWVEQVVLKLIPHPGLSSRKQQNLLLDYGAEGGSGVIELNVRRALLGYLLQRLSIDTTIDHSLNPNAYQLVLENRSEVEQFAGWAFD
ncbi:MAG: WYL domain-containing protein [Gammaproteobacteria bacterium]|nr:WYL domain-containing protein [Gammaproteobacteria bacterium]